MDLIRKQNTYGPLIASVTAVQPYTFAGCQLAPGGAATLCSFASVKKDLVAITLTLGPGGTPSGASTMSRCLRRDFATIAHSHPGQPR